MGMLYVFDRITGKPVWPIPEKKVEKGNVPGEWYSPTQPIPSKPKPYARTGTSVDELIDFTPALRAEALELVKNYKMGPIYTPPVVSNPNGSDRHLPGGHGHGRHQLAGRLLQSGEPHRLYLSRCNACHVLHGAGSAAAGHDRSALCRRSGGPASGDGQCRRRRPGRRCGACAEAAAPPPAARRQRRCAAVRARACR